MSDVTGWWRERAGARAGITGGERERKGGLDKERQKKGGERSG